MAIPSNLSATDTMNAALHAKIVPNQEYLLQGSIMDQSVETLVQRYVLDCFNSGTISNFLKKLK